MGCMRFRFAFVVLAVPSSVSSLNGDLPSVYSCSQAQMITARSWLCIALRTAVLQIGSTAGAIGLLAHEAAQGRSAVLNAVLYDAAHGLNPVAPIDLLALGVGAA